MRIPGMKKKRQTICPWCKKPVPATTVFCEYCGARVARPPSCSLCGTLLAPGSRFCPSCGAPVTTSPEQSEIQSEPSQKLTDTASHPRKESAVVVPKTPECTISAVENTGEQKFQDMPGKTTPGPASDRPGAGKTPDGQSRATITIVPDPDTNLLSGPSRLPVSKIVPYKKPVVILIAILFITGLIIFGYIIRFPVPGSPVGSGTGADQSAGASQILPESSVASDQEHVTTTPTIAIPVFSPEPGQTQVPPGKFFVYFQAERDPFTNIVSVLFMGGKGQVAVQDVVVRLTRSDGQVLTGTFKPLQAGSGVELQGTEKTDRVEVTVHYYTGDTYTVINQTFEYKKLV